MRKIVVFGATGAVGAYTCLHLIEHGYNVIAVGRRRSDNGFFADYGISYLSVDVTNKSDFEKLPLTGVYAVVNLSGVLPAKMKGYTPQHYIDVNVTGGLNVLEYSVKAKIKRFVYSQSISDVSHLCGSGIPISADAAGRFPLDNDHSVYSITKNAAVNLLIHYAVHYHFKYFCLRFPNIYHYHPNPKYFLDGKEQWKGYRLMIEKAMKGEPLQIWGNPNKVRDIVYVKDCAQIIEKTLSSEDAESGTYNVGTGVGTTMEQQVRGIVDVFSPKEKKSPITFAPDKPDTTEYVFDVSKTKENLGYEPQYDYLSYLRDFRREMEAERFHKLWGRREDFSV